MITVELRNILFHAHHGLHKDERKTGNEFSVDLSVRYKPEKKKIVDIDETINYVTLYEILKKEMSHPTDLLETLAIRITESIKDEFKQVKDLEITITKLNPPITNFQGKVSITYKKEF